MKTKRFISAQRISGSSKEVFIINYEGMVVEIERNVNIYEPLKIRLDGDLIDTVPSKQNKEIKLISQNGEHNLHVWNERADNRFFLPIFAKDGVGIIIDGIPVQNSLADPVLKMKSTIAVLWLMVALLFAKSFLLPLANIKEITQPEQFAFIFIYISLFIISLVAAITFKSNPLRSVWLALIVSILELTEYFIFLLSIEISIMTLLFLVLRIIIFSQLVISLRNIKLILSFNDDYTGAPKTVRSKSGHSKSIKTSGIISFKKIILFAIPVILIVGYFFLDDINFFEKKPQIFRSSSAPIKQNLKIPQLVPFVKNGKIQFVDKEGKLIVGNFDEIDESNIEGYWFVLKNGLWGVIDNKGKEVVSINYNKIAYQTDSNLFCVVDQFNDWGLIDDKNNVVIPLIYNSIEKHPTRNLFIVSSFNKSLYGVVDINNKLIIPKIYKDLEFYNDYIIAVKEQGDEDHYSILNLDGTIKKKFSIEIEIPTQDYGLNKNLLVVGWKENYLKNYIIKNSLQQQILLTEGIVDIIDLEKMELRGNGLLSFLFNPNYSKTFGKRRGQKQIDFLVASDWISYKAGVLNTAGEVIIPFQYYDIDYSYSNLGLDSLSASHRFIKVSNGNKWGVVNAYNQIVLPFVFDDIKIFTKGEEQLFAAKNKNLEKMGVLNKDEEIVIPFEYDDIYTVDFNNRLIIAEKNNRTGAIDFKNQVIFPFIYSPDGIQSSEGSIFLVKTVDEDSLNTLMQSKTFHKYNRLEEIHNGLMNGSRSYQGLEIIKNPDYFYSDYTTLELQIILSEPDRRKEFYNTNKMYFKEIYTFEEFTLLLLGDGNYDFPGKWGVININGEILIDCVYDDIDILDKDTFLVEYKNKEGVINLNGDVLIPLKYDRLERYNEYDLFTAELGKTKFFVDLNGKEYYEEN